MPFLVTGCAGFIGYHLVKERLERGDAIIGIDNINDYYDIHLKKARLAQLQKFKGFTFYHGDIADRLQVDDIMQAHLPRGVVNLAAQAGVRYSLENPYVYVQSNLVGFTNLLEACRQHKIEHFVYASTSSVYGANQQQPYQESDGTNHPLTIYAASKKANELIAHSYSHLYQLPTTGLRFFTVYGPWGRPDMAFFSFTRDILAGRPIKIYNHGRMQRDFTYIDDIVNGISMVMDRPATPNPDWSGVRPDAGSSQAPYRVYNLGYGNPVNLLDYIEAIEEALGKKATREFLPMQPGDVLSTHADMSRLQNEFDFTAKVSIQEGVERFVQWYRSYYCNA